MDIQRSLVVALFAGSLVLLLGALGACSDSVADDDVDNTNSDNTGGGDGNGGDGNGAGVFDTGGLGGAIQCVHGQYCPQGCDCDTTSGVGTCMLTDGSGECRYGEIGVDSAAPAFENLTGDWSESYICVDRVGCEQHEALPVVITQNGADLLVEWVGDGASISGDLNGQLFPWLFEGDEYIETGVWYFIDENTCQKVSVWENRDGSNGGHCVGMAVRSPDAAAPIALPVDDCSYY